MALPLLWRPGRFMKAVCSAWAWTMARCRPWPTCRPCKAARSMCWTLRLHPNCCAPSRRRPPSSCCWTTTRARPTSWTASPAAVAWCSSTCTNPEHGWRGSSSTRRRHCRTWCATWRTATCGTGSSPRAPPTWPRWTWSPRTLRAGRSWPLSMRRKTLASWRAARPWTRSSASSPATWPRAPSPFASTARRGSCSMRPAPSTACWANCSQSSAAALPCCGRPGRAAWSRWVCARSVATTASRWRTAWAAGATRRPAGSACRSAVCRSC